MTSAAGAPPLASERLRLRPCAEGDVEALRELFAHPDVRRYLWDDRTASREEVESIVGRSVENARQLGYGLWMLFEPGEEAPVGVCGLRASERGPDLLFAVRPERWGRGIASEAARAVLDHAFGALDVPGVVATVDEPNAASVAVLERIGMRPAGRRLVDGRPILDYALRRSAWAAPPPAVWLRPTRPDDLDFVLALERQPANAPYVGRWTREEHARAIAQDDREHWIIEAGDDRLGYLIAYDLRGGGGGVYVKRIVVAEKGRGLGRAALRRHLAHAFRDLAAPFVWLAVRPANERALRAYRALGFEEPRPDDPRVAELAAPDWRGKTRNRILVRWA